MCIFDWVSKLDLNPLASMVAAFAGAWGAFLFESRRKVEQEKERRCAVANRTLYAFSAMWEVLYQYYQSVIKNFKDNDDAWLNMPADLSHYPNIEFDAEGLAFLLDVGEHQTYPKMMLEELSIIKLIEERNSLLYNVVHTRLADANIQVGTINLAENTVQNIIGIDTMHKLKIYTPQIVIQVQQNLHSLQLAHDELRASLKRLYPKQKFINFQFPAL